VLFANEDTTQSFFASNFGDYSEVILEAQEQNRQGVFLFFHMEECPFCAKMKQYVLNQPQVIQYFNQHFINLTADVNSSLEITDFQGNDMSGKVFAQKYNKVGATPVLAFFDTQGKKIITRTGFVGVEEFLLLAQFVVEKEYENQSFMRYKYQQKRKHSK
jgi:thioredoxin-related protein